MSEQMGVVDAVPTRVLLVQADAVARHAVSRYLEGWGYRVEPLADGAAAAEALLAHRDEFVAVLVDADGDPDGPPAFNQILRCCRRDRQGAVPVLAIVGTAADGAVGGPRVAGLIAAVGRMLVTPPVSASAAEVFDQDTLAALGADTRAELVPGFLRSFRDDLVARVGRIACAAARGDRATIADEGDTLESSAATFGAARVHRAVRLIVDACAAGSFADVLAGVDDLTAAAADVVSTLDDGAPGHNRLV